MPLMLMGKKRGMTQRFDKTGNVVACTVIYAEPNVITQIKRKESDGYNALQLGFDKLTPINPRTLENRMTKQLQGHFKKASVEPRRHLSECRLEEVEQYAVGQELGVSLFAEISHVDVSGISKGKGYQGVQKRWNFGGGRATHGSGFHRHGGSCGQRTTPGRTFPGHKKAGHMGDEMVTVQNLRIVGVDEARHLIIVEGAIPGAKGSLVSIAPAKKKKKEKK